MSTAGPPRGGTHPAAGVPADALPAGLERYRPLRLLGEGGMGRVHLVDDLELGRPVALKVIRRRSVLHERRFRDEMRILSQLEHPNIVPLYDAGLTVSGEPFYTMRYVRGTSLAEQLRLVAAGEPAATAGWRLARLVHVVLQIAQALGYAHDRGVVHRDLKPGNVMLGRHGEVLVLDWGLAKVLEAAGAEPSTAPADTDEGDAEGRIASAGGGLTLDGDVIGTPAFMAPEQATGDAIDARTDVYSLGVILYQALTLRLPFSGPGLLRKILAEEPPRPRVAAPGREIPLELERICLWALRKEPADRPQTCAELARAVQDWLEAETERGKRHELAEAHADKGAARLAAWRDRRAAIRELERKVSELAATFRRWQPISEKRPLLDAEQRLETERDRLSSDAGEALAALTESLGFERDNARARALLAEHYYERLLEAEAAGDRRGCEALARLVERYHDGRYALELQGDGTLSLESDPPGAEVRLFELVEEDLVLVPRHERHLGRTPFGPVPLAMGSYLLLVRSPGLREARYPVHVTRNLDWSGHLRLYPDHVIGEGFACIPAGPFVFGGDDKAPIAPLPRSRPSLDDFFIAVQPVTVGEYLAWLDELAAAQGLAAAERHAPRRPGGGATYLVRHGERLVLPEVDADGDRWDPRHPVTYIGYEDVLAYCAWRSLRDGRTYRLPSEIEWEKAARGVDGRLYPWGNRFDPTLAKTRDSGRGRNYLEPIDSYPGDTSIYGVRGMAGNIEDWTSTIATIGGDEGTREGRVIRGGGWANPATAARVASRFLGDLGVVYGTVGFRLGCSPPSP